MELAQLDTNIQANTQSIQPTFRKVTRAEIKGLSSISIEGKETYLGELKNFKNHSYLEKFLPKDLSVGWVKLYSFA